MYRLTIKDILEATGGVLLCGDENTEIKDVCINSKEIKPGDLFVPIIGERVDAHRFIESALHTEDWMKNVTSGDYQKYYDDMYANK